MGNLKILAVDDEEDILELFEFNLAREGFQVKCCSSAEEGLKASKTIRLDPVVLDLMLPRMSGLDFCRKLKADPLTAAVPIILVSAKNTDTDIVVGLELGADDYLTKPFSPRVLVARVRALLRRETGAAEPSNAVVRIDELTINPSRFEAALNDERLDLTATEFRLLLWLASHPGRVYSRGAIVQGVHGADYPVTDRSVDVQILSLRKKLEHCSHYIETVRGVGYRFKDSAVNSISTEAYH